MRQRALGCVGVSWGCVSERGRNPLPSISAEDCGNEGKCAKSWLEIRSYKRLGLDYAFARKGIVFSACHADERGNKRTKRTLGCTALALTMQMQRHKNLKGYIEGVCLNAPMIHSDQLTNPLSVLGAMAHNKFPVVFSSVRSPWLGSLSPI